MPESLHVEDMGPLQRMLQSQPQFIRELLAGGMAGGLSKTSVAPLERTKILLQTGRTQGRGIWGTLEYVWQAEGFQGLFRGNTASVLRIVPYAAIHFSAYEWYRRLLIQHALPSWEGARHSHVPVSIESRSNEGRSGDARTASATGSNGIESVTVAAQISTHTTPANSVLFPSIPVNRVLTSHHPSHVHPVWDLLAGSAAGATAVIFTYPLDLVRTRLAWSSGLSTPTFEKVASLSSAASVPSRASVLRGNASLSAAEVSTSMSSPEGRSYPSAASSNIRPAVAGGGSTAARARIWAELSKSFAEGGVAGLYRGMSPTLLGILPYAGLKFYCYQSFKAAYRKHQLKGEQEACTTGVYTASAPKKLPVHLMLLFGGVSGLAAQTVTYPLDVIRRRMQVHSILTTAISSQQPPLLGMSPAPHSFLPPQPAVCRLTTMSILKSILREEGVRGLFRGVSLNYIKAMPSTAIGFTVYDMLKSYLGVEGHGL